MDQLQYMCADFGNCLDQISDEMCQMNTRIGHIAHQQSRLGDFVLSPSLYPAEDSSLGGGDGDDEDASGFEYDDGRIASQWFTHCHSWQKGRVVLYMRVVFLLGGELA